jgi:hypothetical protein
VCVCLYWLFDWHIYNIILLVLLLPLYPEHQALGFRELIDTSVYSCPSAAPRTI